MEGIADRPRVRRENLERLAAAGFRGVDWMPLREHRGIVRPVEEIAARAMCLAVAHVWTSDPESSVSSAVIAAHLGRNGLDTCFTPTEAALLGAERGGRLGKESLFLDHAEPLAWALGFQSTDDFNQPASPVGDVRTPARNAQLVRFLFRGGDLATEMLCNSLRPVPALAGAEDLAACALHTFRLGMLDHPDVRVLHAALEMSRGARLEAHLRSLSWCFDPAATWDESSSVS